MRARVEIGVTTPELAWRVRCGDLRTPLYAVGGMPHAVDKIANIAKNANSGGVGVYGNLVWLLERRSLHLSFRTCEESSSIRVRTRPLMSSLVPRDDN